jgi:thiosulfate/3-mercaptopyruvate sulfurtransferase
MTDMLVDADWVAANGGSIRLVDVRDAWEFDGIGHLPGAVNVPFDRFRADRHGAEGRSGGEGMLPGADVFAAVMGEAGISRDDTVVAYDDDHGVFAARLLVTAELYGHPRDRLFLLDGDFSGWQREREVSTEAPSVTAVTYETDRPADSPLVDVETVAEAAADPEAILVDTREEWEFAEGHIPGAIRLDWRELVDDDTRGIKPAGELREILQERGIVPEKRIVLYCNTARRISHTYVVLRHLGYGDIAFYEGSLTEWEASGRPLATE